MLQSQLLTKDPTLKDVMSHCQAVEIAEVHQKKHNGRGARIKHNYL
jgi:hypothetical protein